MDVLLTPLAMATALGGRCGSVWISGDTSIRPNTTAQEEAVHVIQAIKTAHPIPVIVVAVHPVAGDAVLAAGADGCLDIPARSPEITSAVATCLGL